MTVQYNKAFVHPPQSGSEVLLKNKLHYLIPLIKSLPGLPRVSKVKCRLCTMTPATKPPTPGTSLPCSQAFHVPWHFALQHPKHVSPQGPGTGSIFCLKYFAPSSLKGCLHLKSNANFPLQGLFNHAEHGQEPCCATLYSQWYLVGPESMSVASIICFSP